MAGIEDQIRPNVTVGQEPNAAPNPNPLSPQADIPQAPPTPQPPQGQQVAQASPPTQGEQPPQAPPAGGESELDQFQKLLDQHKPEAQESDTLEQRVKGDGFVQSIKRSVQQEFQAFAAKNRKNVAQSGEEAQTGVEKVYGKDNVQLRGKDLWVRPEGAKTFRKLDQGVIDPYIDFFLSRLVSAPGFAANVATTAATGLATVTAGTAAGGAMGGPPGAMVGAAGGAAAANAAGGAANTFVDRMMNKVLGQASEDTNTSEIAKDAAKTQAEFGAIFGAGSQYLSGKAEQQAAKSVGMSIEDFKAQKELLKDAGPDVDKLAQVKSGLRNLVNMVTGRTQTTEPGANFSATKDAIDDVHQDLGKRVGLVKDKVIELGNRSGNNKVSPNATINKLQDELSSQGIAFKDDGTIDTSRSNPRATVDQGNLSKLSNTYSDYLKDSQSGGTNFERHMAYMDDFSKLSNYDTTSPEEKRAAQTFRDIRAAMNMDAGEHIDATLKGSGTVQESTWQQAMSDYHDKIEGINLIKDKFQRPEDIEQFVKNFHNAGGNANKMEILNDLKTTLGENSEHWNGIRSDLLNRIVMSGNKSGAINPSAVKGYLSNENNQPLLKQLFPDAKSLNTFKAVVAQADKISTTPALSEGQEAAISKMVDLFKDWNSPVKTVKNLWSLFGNNKAAISHLSDELVDAADKVYGSQQRENILQIYNANTSLMKKMRSVVVKPGSGAPPYERFVPTAPAAVSTQAPALPMSSVATSTEQSQPQAQ